MVMNFKRPFTVSQAEEILRKAKLDCAHQKLVFQRVRQPSWLEDAEQSNAWTYRVTCKRCSAIAQHETSSPICIKCSSAKGPEIMRLVTTKEDPTSRYGKIFVYTCDKCKKNEEVTFKSGYS